MNKKLWLTVIMLLTVVCLATGCAAPADGEQPAADGSKPLVVGYSPFSEKFNPFFAEIAPDVDVTEMVTVYLLTTDRAGAVVAKAADGETIAYNGVDYDYQGVANIDVVYDEAADQTVYTWTLREDVLFSDGQPLTADDVIFSYYVLADPSYDGAHIVYSVPIAGLQNYRTQTNDDIYQRYAALYQQIYAAGRDYQPDGSEAYTAEQYDSLWAIVDEVWLADVQAIIDYCLANYLEYAEADTGFTAGEIAADESLQALFGMVEWGYGYFDDSGALIGAISGNSWDLASDFPTVEDFFAECQLAYAYDAKSYSLIEQADDSDVYYTAMDAFILEHGSKDQEMGGGVPNIAGIRKLGDYQVEITVLGFDAAAIHALNIPVAPLHYYGDAAKYDYERNMFGFDYGDLSTVRARTNQPLGAGPYKFVKYENKVVYFEANADYYKGAPLTQYVQFIETNDADSVSGVRLGVIDVGMPSFSEEAVAEICSYNSNGELSGDIITTVTTDHLGYGYVGVNADTVKVGDDPASEASRNLRRGLATVLAAYRELSIDSYYGELAQLINYPISDCSWAAPRPTDDGYRAAYSQTVDGGEIYSAGMDAEAGYAAALAAAVDYFKAAGFTFDESSGMFTAAPEGASLSYEVLVSGYGVGDHPSFMMLTQAAAALATIGITLTVNDPADPDEMYDAIDVNAHQLWCAAWDTLIDPDIYQIYHSDNIGYTNYYNIADAELDRLLLEARSSDDTAFRKAAYRACLELILDWAVEVPVYQRQNCVIFSAERIEAGSITPDITTYWDWLLEVELIKMVEAQ
ncbi:MAG: ABC transporter substrate-binding protein [Bacillota bacterium]|nr:ABC transporter substrate-binding protein [Bacillota bacterium]